MDGSREQKLAAYLADRDVACPGCGYNLRGLKSRECPECGRDIAVDLWAGRARRHLRWALAAVGVFGALAVLVIAWLGFSAVTMALGVQGVVTWADLRIPVQVAGLALAFAVPAALTVLVLMRRAEARARRDLTFVRRGIQVYDMVALFVFGCASIGCLLALGMIGLVVWLFVA